MKTFKEYLKEEASKTFWSKQWQVYAQAAESMCDDLAKEVEELKSNSLQNDH